MTVENQSDDPANRFRRSKGLLDQPVAQTADDKQTDQAVANSPLTQTQEAQTQEIGGPEGPEPTRYGDWEKKGRCIDF